MIEKKRNESDIFNDLATLCSLQGYVHAIAYFCYRDNTIGYSDVMTTNDVLGQYEANRLLRTEISTLIGLASKNKLNTDLPAPETMQGYIDETEGLLNEIHRSMIPAPKEFLNYDNIPKKDFNPLRNGAALRESIFYGGESAYLFQYRDLSAIKYLQDDQWIQENKGYSIEQAIAVMAAIQSFQNEKLNQNLLSLKNKHPNEWSFLEAFIFSSDDISNESGIENHIVSKILRSFVSPVSMEAFEALDDFNPRNAYPIIDLDGGRYLLFQSYSLVEALYETPFFWFHDDKSYRSTAMKNRGDFTENFSTDRLRRVFGENRVFQNINIIDNSKNVAGEIDVLVIYANRAIVLQAKSKKLTIASRKGNDLCLRDDFKKAVQDSYDQAYTCSLMLNDKKNYKLVDAQGIELQINRQYKEIYPLCVVSDHYPSLSFQARQFLTSHTTETIQPPFVMDVFFLDVATEMLASPLYFLSYINRRTGYAEKIFSTHELTILSYHLKQNLFMDHEYSMLHLGDDIGADLDVAMLSRRDGAPGADTPDGILTKFQGTILNDLISQIESQEDPGTIDLGFMLLLLSEDTINELNSGIDHITDLSRKDGLCHDITIAIDNGDTGLTIHTNNNPIESAGPKLERHAETRKYTSGANSWFGICLDPKTRKIRFGLELCYEWEKSEDLDSLVKGLPKAQTKINLSTVVKGRRTGRNEKCPCGSGIKYKKCCLT